MAESELQWSGARLGTASIEADNVRGEGRPEYPQLVVPVRLRMKLATPVKDAKAYLRLLSASTSLRQDGCLVADSVSEVLDMHLFAHSASDVRLRFPLDRSRVEALDRNRAGNLSLVLDGQLLFDVHPDGAAAGLQTETLGGTAALPSGLFTARYQLSFSIPRSHWADVILPALGWNAFRIVEIPLPRDAAWRTVFVDCVVELDQAEQHLRNGRYDECVARLRVAIEPIRKRIQSWKSQNAAGREREGLAGDEFQLLRAVACDTAAWLASLHDRFFSLASKTHHPPATCRFTRDQAHALYGLATSLIMYSAEALPVPMTPPDAMLQPPATA